MLANPAAMHPSAYMPHPGDSPGSMPPGMPQHPGVSPGMPGLKLVSAAKEDMNDGDMDSEPSSEKEDELDSEKLDASHQEIIEKLKRQEMEERQEIERELEEVRREAAIGKTQDRMRTHETDLDKDKDQASSLDSDNEQLEIKMQRPLGLLASHGLTTKSHSSHSLYEKERGKEREKERVEQPDNTTEDSEVIVPSPSAKAEDRETDEWGHDQNIGLDYSRSGPSFSERAFMPSPPLSSPSNDLLGASPGHHWTFEEQFKQLYELSSDTKRQEFLDDLFSFMQKRGTPVNRIPIMAKQTLDLYELFRLVASKGGLVEVINKKLWREITKGLNLPSSITSAAFTLRTQYMKYLYPYECDKLKLSSPNELQTAIDGNRREGRRPSYGYDFSPVPTMLPTGPPLSGGPPGPPMSHLNGALLNGRPDISSMSSSIPVGFPLPAAYGVMDMKLSNGCCSSGEDENSVPASTQLHLRSLAERDARAMEAAAHAMEEATKRMSDVSRSPSTSVAPIISQHHRNMLAMQHKMEPPPKRLALDEDRLFAHMGMPSAHLKITSRNDGRAEFDNSLVVSMEINGIMYQGVLFAQHPRDRR